MPGMIPLKPPVLYGNLESALHNRRSIRRYTGAALQFSQLSQLLWAGVGRNHRKRTVPSAGGLNPLILYIVANNVSDLPRGLYRYDPVTHALETLKEQDLKDDFYKVSLAQEAVLAAAANLVIAADFNETVDKYGDRGRRYVHMTAGAAAQSLALQATALKIGSVAMGAFRDRRMKALLGIPEDPLCIVCVGRV
jgi:SagB-type dehydrogenase family enzyme